MRDEAIDSLLELCQKDKRYLNLIRESSIVKNAPKILRGGAVQRRRGDDKEEEEKKRPVEDYSEVDVRGKIRLLELLVEVVNGGMEEKYQEELLETVLQLDYEANTHLEEEEGEGEGEGEEEGEGGKEREKMEWEELSERVNELVWVMESLKKRRKKNRKSELEWMERKKEENIEKENEEMRKKTEEMERENYRIEGENRELSEEMGRIQEDNSHLKELCPQPLTLNEMRLNFTHPDKIRREENQIVHYGSEGFANCLLGEVLSEV